MADVFAGKDGSLKNVDYRQGGTPEYPGKID
jgi:hypothetical protein